MQHVSLCLYFRAYSYDFLPEFTIQLINSVYAIFCWTLGSDHSFLWAAFHFCCLRSYYKWKTVKLNNPRRLNHPASITQFNLVCSSENRVTGQPHVCLTSTYYFKVSFTTAVNFSLLVCKSCIKFILLITKHAFASELVLTINILLYSDFPAGRCWLLQSSL